MIHIFDIKSNKQKLIKLLIRFYDDKKDLEIIPSFNELQFRILSQINDFMDKSLQIQNIQDIVIKEE